MITPNVLTVARVFLAFVICAILVSTTKVSALFIDFFLFVLACFTDWWDGELARKQSMVTDFGKIADPIADKVLVLGLLFSFVYLKVYSIWWVIPILLREVVVTWIRTHKILNGRIIAAEFSGKIKTVVQLIAAGIAFLVVVSWRVSDPPMFADVLQPLLYIMLIAANALTLISGYLFLKRNLD